MKGIVWALILAVAWILITGNLTLLNFVAGLIIGAGVLVATQSAPSFSRYGRLAWRMVALGGFTVVALVAANLRVARDIFRPRDELKPGFIDLPLDVTSDAEISLLGTLITLTPGTTAIDVSADRRILYVHSISIPNRDVEQARRDLKEGFEHRIRRLSE